MYYNPYKKNNILKCKPLFWSMKFERVMRCHLISHVGVRIYHFDPRICFYLASQFNS